MRLCGVQSKDRLKMKIVEKMNPKEKEIIKHLRHGKRVNMSAIARELGMPITTVADRIRKIDERYVVKRASLLDYSRMGYSSHHIIAVKLSNEQKQAFLEYMKEQKCVNSIYRTNSGFNFIVEVVFRSNFDFITWIEELKPRFRLEMSSFQILNTEEKEIFIPE